MTFQVRFLYEDHLFGEWADARPGDYLYPNPGYRVTAVQFRDDENSKPGTRRRDRLPNGEAA